MANLPDPIHRRKMFVRPLYFTLVVCLTVILPGERTFQAQAEEVHNSPSEVVAQWVQSYPQDLTHAVTLTSPEFRNHMPPTEWIDQKKSILKNIRLKLLDSQILKEDIDGTDAVIRVKVLIDTVVGEHVQFEQYTLHRYCSVWLLEQVRILDEQYVGHTMKRTRSPWPNPSTPKPHTPG